MTIYYLLRNRLGSYEMKLRCCGVYLLFVMMFLPMAILANEVHADLLKGFFLIWGWFTWTFAEYMAHRFWMHARQRKRAPAVPKSHIRHHAHPTEIKISNWQRIGMLLLLMLLLFLSSALVSYFSLFTGFYSGFVFYCHMHVLLHKRWTARLFARLHSYHIYHHCLYPNRCFGVCVTWWDTIFKTAPPRNAEISERTKAFYYGIH